MTDLYRAAIRRAQSIAEAESIHDDYRAAVLLGRPQSVIDILCNELGKAAILASQYHDEYHTAMN